MNDKVMFFVINEEGIREDAQILAKYKLPNMNNYITYTYGEINDNNMIKIYTSGVVYENGNYTYREIISDDEWTQVKDVMKSIARDESEPIDPRFVSDLRFEGEEVSIRRPKKLLVSKKFADTLSSKYKENVVHKSYEPISTINNINILNNNTSEEKEELLNRTIEIPTFEELQARNKNIENVIKSTKPEVSIEQINPPVHSLDDFKVKVPEVKPVDTSVTSIAKDDLKNYKAQFKEQVEPLLMGVYEKQMKHIEELEEELSKTKFDLFEKQKEALSLKQEKEKLEDQSNVLKQELEGAQEKMNGILSVIQGNNKD